MNIINKFIYSRKATFLQIVVLIIALQKCEAKLSVECVVDYLKFRHFDVNYFSSVGTFNGNPSACSDDIRSQVEAIYYDEREKLNRHAVKAEHTECVIKEIKTTEDFESRKLAAFAANLKGVGLKFWKSGDKNKYIEKNNKEAQDLEDNAFVKCQGQKRFGEFYDSYFEQKKAETFADDFDLCLRKYIIDRQILKNNQYGLTLNPRRIQTNKINCDEVMTKVLDEMKSQVRAEGGLECSVDIFISNGYLDELLKIQLLSKLLNLQPAEKELERQTYVDQMVKLTNLIKSCPMNQS
jgi:hypothetical protein